jgi:hypothetical protein
LKHPTRINIYGDTGINGKIKSVCDEWHVKCESDFIISEIIHFALLSAAQNA